MLVLTRKIGEGINIDDSITITIVQIKGKQVRIGVQAPQSHKVYRTEVYTAILQQNQEALAASNHASQNLMSALVGLKEKGSYE
jgi:carbon storage regulator